MKIDFEFETEYGIFRDSLTLPENIVYGEDAIQAMKEHRAEMKDLKEKINVLILENKKLRKTSFLLLI